VTIVVFIFAFKVNTYQSKICCYWIELFDTLVVINYCLVVVSVNELCTTLINVSDIEKSFVAALLSQV